MEFGKMIKKLIAVILISSTLHAEYSTGAQSSNSSVNGCRLFRSYDLLVHVGWPISFDFSDLVSEHLYELDYEDESNEARAKCQIFDGESNEALWEQNITAEAWYNVDSILDKYHAGVVSLNSTTKYLLKYTAINSSCIYEEIVLNLTSSPEHTCSEAIEEHHHLKFDTQETSYNVMSCEVAYDSSQPKVHLDVGKHNFSIRWYRNCSQIYPENYPNQFRQIGRELHIHSASYNITGVYSCAFSYDGLTRFAQHYDFCVRAKTSLDFIPQLSCPEVVKARLGQNVTISCDVHLGYGSVNPLFFDTHWKQTAGPNNHTCSNNFVNVQPGFYPRTSCIFGTLQDQEVKCFLYDPSEADKIPVEKIWNVNFTIVNLKKSDIGEYTVTFSKFSESTNDTIRLVLEETSESTFIYIIVGVSVAVFITLCILLTLVLYYLRKRSFKA